MTQIQVQETEYGPEYGGTYQVRKLLWSEGRELLRRLAATKDTVGYIEDLMIASISGPVKLERGKLQEVPMQLIRRLQDAALANNETSKAESAFLSS